MHNAVQDQALQIASHGLYMLYQVSTYQHSFESEETRSAPFCRAVGRPIQSLRKARDLYVEAGLPSR